MHSADDVDFMKKWPWIKIRGFVLRIHLSYCSYNELHQWYIGGVHTGWSQYIDWIRSVVWSLVLRIHPSYCSYTLPSLHHSYCSQMYSSYLVNKGCHNPKDRGSWTWLLFVWQQIMWITRSKFRTNTIWKPHLCTLSATQVQPPTNVQPVLKTSPDSPHRRSNTMTPPFLCVR